MVGMMIPFGVSLDALNILGLNFRAFDQIL